MKRALCVLALFTTAACGGGSTVPPIGDGHPNDGGGDAGHASLVLALGADFTTPAGTLAAVDPTTLSVTKMAAPAGSDAMIRVEGPTRVYVVDRAGSDSHDNVELIDPTRLGASPLVWQMTTGAMSNPQDVLPYMASKLYVPVYGSGQLVVLDYASGAMKGTVDLSSTTYDTDGVPEMHSVAFKSGLVWVTLQALDSSYTPEHNGVVVAIDPATDKVKGSVTLSTVNPTTMLVDEPGTDNLLVGTTPSYTTPTMGCIERIDTKAVASKGCAIQNAVLGGYADHFQVEPSGTFVLAVSPTSTTGQLEIFDPATGTTPKVLSPSTEVITDCLALPDGTIFASDTGGPHPGVRVYSASGSEKTTAAAPLDIGLTPQFVDGLAYVP